MPSEDPDGYALELHSGSLVMRLVLLKEQSYDASMPLNFLLKKTFVIDFI
ncbi:hypothetical protein [Marinomonas primoryensis]